MLYCSYKNLFIWIVTFLKLRKVQISSAYSFSAPNDYVEVLFKARFLLPRYLYCYNECLFYKRISSAGREGMIARNKKKRRLLIKKQSTAWIVFFQMQVNHADSAGSALGTLHTMQKKTRLGGGFKTSH